jgi:omega-amidase
MKVALLQLNSVWEAPRENHSRAAELIRIAAAQGCDVAVLPEMFPTGTSSNTAVTAEPADGPTHTFLAAAAHKHAMNIIAGCALQGPTAGSKAANIAAVYSRQGERVALYTKIYPFSPALENRTYEAGRAPVVFMLEGAACGIFICYDLRFPEVFRSIAKKVQVIFVIANWPRVRIEHWDALLRARAIENQCFVIGVNRTGMDGNGLYYSGGSQIIDPWGRGLCHGSERDAVVIEEFDPREAERYRAKYKFLNDMKPVKTFLD